MLASVVVSRQRRSLRYNCCHEAGHAVIAEHLGYRISRIEETQVVYEPQAWKCPDCGREIKNRHCPELLAGLDDNCASCKQEKFKFIERCFAGGAATFVLQEPEHDCNDSDYDRIEVAKVYPTGSTPNNPSPQRQEAFSLGWQRARNSVTDHKAEIGNLRDALEKAMGQMSGEQARRIINR
jgi:hypothetical protein